MEEINYYLVDIDNVSLNPKFVLMMNIIDFSNFIRNNGIKDIFISEYSEKFISTKKVEPKYKGSKIFYSFDCNKVLMLWTDSWGYDSIEYYEESSKNGIFYTINSLKKDYSNEDEWNDSPGRIYQLLRSWGYKSSKVVEYSARFFQGNLFRYEIYNKVRKLANKGKFRNITELIISSKAAFENLDDYYDAKELKAPNMVTLSSMRLIEEIKRKFKFEDYTSALLFAVMLKLKKSMEEDKGEQGISLDEIRRGLEKYTPKNVYEGFRKIESDEDIINKIQNEFGFSIIGYYNQWNKYFYFSKLKIYIDASNVIHNGQRRGGKNTNTVSPKIEFLDECIKNLREHGIKVTGAFLDYSKNDWLKLESIKSTIDSSGNELPKSELEFNKYQELKKKLRGDGITVTETVKNETADVKLIQKLIDDPSCYVVSNDSFEEFNLLKSQRRRLINFERMDDGKYRFFAQTDDQKDMDPKEIYTNKTKGLERYEDVTSLENIGKWTYPDRYDYEEISEFLNKHL